MTSPSNSPAGGQRRAAIIGTGLIGGSIGMALRRQGWWVSGTDRDPSRAQRALELGAIDEVGVDMAAAVTFIAVPAGTVAEVAKAVLSQQDAEDRSGAVTDVAGIKETIVSAVGHPRFVGGHPMAGSEQEGVDGAGPTCSSGPPGC